MKKFCVLLGLALFANLLILEPALAGPGGKIAQAAFETFWGKVILALLTLFFLPLILYMMVHEKIAERRTRKDLAVMAGYSSTFEWLNMLDRIKDCFYRVHSGWQNEDLSDVSKWMTDWYWQNQQLVYLNRWKRDGLINICNVKKIKAIKPLLFAHKNEGEEHENSLLVVEITANMQDYLMERATEKVVEGSKRYKEVETLWSFRLEAGQWKVANIEETSMSMDYAKLAKQLPAIETTLIEKNTQ